MKARKIRTDWGALSLAHDGSVVFCAQQNSTLSCIRFDSAEQFMEAIKSRRLLVKKWAVAVPRRSCILKSLALPASDLSEAARMIEFELPSLVPVPLEEVVYGCTVLSKQPNMLNVLVCILKLNTLNQHLKPYRDIGVEPHLVIFDSLAIQSWFNSTSSTSRAAPGPLIGVLVNTSRSVVLTSVKGNFHKGNELTLSGTDTAILPREIVQEISNQLEELPDILKNKAVIVIAGTENHTSQIRNLFHSKSRDATVANETAVVSSPEITCYTNGKCEPDADTHVLEAVVAAGLLDLAKSSNVPFFNLLPQEYLGRFRRKTLLFNCLFAALALLMSISFFWLCLWAMNRRIESKSNRIASQIAPIESIAGNVDKKRQRVRAIQNQLANRGLITQIFQELYEYTPNNISISELRILPERSGASIEIKGQADLLSSAFEYTDAMREAALLKQIQIVNAQQIPRLGGSVVEFQARCVIRDH